MSRRFDESANPARMSTSSSKKGARPSVDGTGMVAIAAAVLLTVLCATYKGFDHKFTHVTEEYNPYREFNTFINDLVYKYLGLDSIAMISSGKTVGELLTASLGYEGGYYMACYLRDLLAGTGVYWITAGVWHYIVYHIYGKDLFENRNRARPDKSVIIDQMCLAQASLFVYAALPILSEYMIENNLTRTYYNINDIGGPLYYSIFLVIYIILVEFGIYWMHRTLHTNKFLYKYIHGLHHKYNMSNTGGLDMSLTPWASIAFNPLDGILQASPYTFFLLFVPVHYYTHVFLLFFSGVWATNIHDAVWGDSEPIMGAKYHTLHHTHYMYNYGQFFTYCDYIFGTLKVPDEEYHDKYFGVGSTKSVEKTRTD